MPARVAVDLCVVLQSSSEESALEGGGSTASRTTKLGGHGNGPRLGTVGLRSTMVGRPLFPSQGSGLT